MELVRDLKLKPPRRGLLEPQLHSHRASLGDMMLSQFSPMEDHAMQFEPFEDAIKWRKVHRNKLKGVTGRRRRAARPLMTCRKHHRCRTEACRVCMWEVRLWWAGEAVRIVLQRPYWTRCSVITKGLLVPYGQLAKFDLTAAVKRIRKRLQRSGISGKIVLGGLDVSLNIENNVITGWQFHLYLIVEGQNDERLRQAVRDAFPPDGDVQQAALFFHVFSLTQGNASVSNVQDADDAPLLAFGRVDRREDQVVVVFGAATRGASWAV